MKNFISRFLILLPLFSFLLAFDGQYPSGNICESLRNRIEEAGVPPIIRIGKERIYASAAVPLFYQQRAFQPAWCDGKYLIPSAYKLRDSIKEAYLEGLNPEDYHLSRIEWMIEELAKEQDKGNQDPDLLADMDLLLTDAFLIYGSHLVSGKVNPESLDSQWIASRREVSLVKVLDEALRSQKVAAALKDLLPDKPGYFRLRDALSRYRRIAATGGWETIPEGPKIEKGDKNERVALLKHRLQLSGDLSAGSDGEPDVFDDVLEESVIRFQKRNGLDADGVVGKDTLAALNIPVEDRIQQIRLNMERWRWLPQDLGSRYILVNVANFELDVVEDSQIRMNMRVVVGKEYQKTPVFSAKMDYLVINPYWNLPDSIAAKEVIPSVRKDPEYLAKENIRVLKGWGAEAEEIDPDSIDWASVSTKKFSYRFRQDPGPKNALGRVKFMFPNKFDIYLHDTPAVGVFARTMRASSHGCIRVEKPIELAEYLLQDDTQWIKEKILAAIESKIEQTVRLPNPIPVHLLYWTAWADEGGSIEFRRDIYSRDEALSKGLEEKAVVELPADEERR
jgi:murein L,D-transpeptidase YcbB/YkuD